MNPKETQEYVTIKDAYLWIKLLEYSDRYQINFQMWPNQYTIYVEKDHVELYSFGTDNATETMLETLRYLDRINRKR